MIYPKFLKAKGVIGVTAPSKGCADEISFHRLDNAIKAFEKMNYNLVITDNVRKNINSRSSLGKT